MKVIWKFKISGELVEVFDAPAGAIAVRALMQADGQPVVYLLCERQTSKAKHQICLFPTGGNIPEDSGTYIDTLTVSGPTGPFVVHVFHRQLGVITNG